MNNNSNIKLSKFLSFISRHKPETIGINLDSNGWASVTQLIEKLNQVGKQIDLDKLKEVVETDNKQRFSFSVNLDKIRANQGHSIKIDLDYIPQEPPKFLYHGTAERFVNSILETGIVKKNRHHVHLSSDVETALKVGQRHGKPFIFKILALEMFNAGYVFYLSDNLVWLTDEVPIKYLSVLEK